MDKSEVGVMFLVVLGIGAFIFACYCLYKFFILAPDWAIYSSFAFGIFSIFGMIFSEE